jgi:flagellin
MAFGIGSINNQANTALTQLQQLQRDLLRPFQAAATGKRINSAADDPSGLALATALQVQSSGFDQGSRNAIDARNAVNVADGALQTTSSALQSLRSLGVQASNDLLSTGDRQNIQRVADGLVRQINADAQNATFNGTPLLNGTFGSQPATAASATVTTNAALGGGGTLVAATTAVPASQGGTIGVSVVNAGGGNAAIDVTFTASATGQTTNFGPQAAGSTIVVNGTSVTLGNAAAADVGATATVQVQAATAGSSAPDAQVQTGANQGATTALALPNGSSSALFIQHLDFSTTATATNAVGQVDAAIGAATAARASLGAQAIALGNQVDANNVASNALTASASNVQDANAGQTSTELYRLLVQSQISLETLRNANTQFGYLNRFFNTSG